MVNLFTIFAAIGTGHLGVLFFESFLKMRLEKNNVTFNQNKTDEQILAELHLGLVIAGAFITIGGFYLWKMIFTNIITQYVEV